MSVLEIRPAQREGARLVIGLAGISGSGKTRTALELAYGLAKYDPTKIGFMDTENRRGALYADVLQQSTPPTNVPFMYGELVAPFSPQRYIDGIHEFEKAGVEVLVVDSITHEHEGPGGLIEIAGVDNKYWNRAKYEHKRFVSALLQCNMHIIVCVRAREKVLIGRNAAGKTEISDEGLQPVTEKNLMFEMTASLMMHDEGWKQTALKVPGQLRHILGRGEGYITPADGEAIRDWVDGAQQLDPTVVKFRNRLVERAEKGVEFINNAWSQIPPAIQAALGENFKKVVLASAKSYDDNRAAAEADAAATPSTPAASSPTSSAAAAAAIAKAAAAGRSQPQAQVTTQAPTTGQLPTQVPVTVTHQAATATVVVPIADAKPDPAPAAADPGKAKDNVRKLREAPKPPIANTLPPATPAAPPRVAMADPLF